MATRIYLPSSGSPAVTPSTWNFGAQINPLTFAGARSKTSSALTTKTEATGTTNPTARAMLRYVVGPLSAQTISGTLKGQMICSESNSGANATVAIAAKIIQPGGADRAVLLAQTASTGTATPPEMATTLTNRRFLNSSDTAAMTLTSQAATEGDYLVIEIGFRSATSTTRNVSLRYGDTGSTDLAENDTTTTDNVPWVEFSGTILFSTTGTLSQTQQNYTSSAAGTIAISGSSAATQADDTVSSAGTVDISGSSSQTQADDTLSAAGTVDNGGTTGDASLTQAADSLSSAGSVDIAGSGSPTASDDALSSAGTVDVSGAGSGTQEADSASGAASVDLSGSAAQPQAADSLTAAGAVALTGDATPTQAADSVASDGTVSITGTGSPAAEADTVTASGTVGNPDLLGDAALTQDAQTLSAAGKLPIDGAASLIQEADALSAAGDLPISGAGSGSQSNTGAAAGTVAISGESTLSQEPDAVAAAALLPISGETATTQEDDSLTATVTVISGIEGAATVSQAAQTVTGAGLVLNVEAVSFTPLLIETRTLEVPEVITLISINGNPRELDTISA